MSFFEVTLCVNPNARQFDKKKLAEIEEIIKANRATYNILAPFSLKNTSSKNLASLLIAVGGDGTLNLVANAALKHGRKLAIIPLGTFNHFAKDLGLPLELEKATHKALSGTVRRVDAGQVNGRLFLNNSAIGFYPHLVAKRKSLQGKLGKWLALIIAAFLMMFKIRRYRLQLTANGQTRHVRTSLLVVANNKYNLKEFGLAERKKLNEGKLYVYVVKSHGILGMLGVSLRLLLGKVSTNDFDCYDTKTLRVTGKKSLHVACDGENIRLKTPLAYTSLPKALKVIA